MISKFTFFLGSLALLMFLVITTEADARGRAGGKSVSRSGPASGGSVKSARQPNASTKAKSIGDARDRKQDARDDRRDHKDDVRDDRRDFRDDVRDDRRDFRDDVRDDRRRWRVGSVLTVSAFRALTCTTETIIVGNVTYYRCGTTWYSKAHQGGNVTYIVVTAPAGY
jgi:hypothetical protein